jgi:hypothetical protein
VLLRRWVVERTFAWLGRYRRLSKDYEFLPQSSQAIIYLAMTRLMLKRLGNMDQLPAYRLNGQRKPAELALLSRASAFLICTSTSSQ